ncbi:hypothetical protein BBJ28_00021546 [Nothophytophthora sp. Chile5]|nr:hypothetical protein BBJ28_00021546 [Nothophytophthora sp. Chile5]
MATPNFSIADASGVNVGSSEIVLTTDTFCASSTIQLNVSEGSSSSSSASSVDVSSLNTTSNGTIVVELASPLSSSLEGGDLQFSLSQCGVSASAGFSVDEDTDASSSSSTEATEASADGSEAVGGSSTGTETTQEENASTGLSHSVIVGIVIAVVALLGFVFECVHHKRRQPVPAPQDSTVNNLTTPL